MHLVTLMVASALVSSTCASLNDNVLAARQTSTEDSYLQQVCFPNTTDPIPPCQEIINIETACQPNGTTSLYLLAHAECMCGGSFFSDWVACLNCDYVHGARSQQEVDEFTVIITSASNLLCTGTPTASFAAIFNSLSAVGAAASGSTVFSDQYPNNTAISLYYTATGSQGLGAITGSATAAVAQVTTLSGSGTSAAAETSKATTTSKAGAATGGSSSGGGSTSTSKAGAAPTGVMVAMLGAVAGGVIMAAL